MLRRTRVSIAALGAVAAMGCDAARSTVPLPSTTPQENANTDKQGTTSSAMLLEYNPPGSDIYRMNDDGTELVQLTTDFGTEFDPSWAPDGKRVLYAARSFENNVPSIFVMNSDGTGVTQLSHPGLDEGDGEPATLGKGIVFGRLNTFQQVDIYRMNADGTGLTQLTFGQYDNDPAPSPKATSLAFVRDEDIYVLDLTTGGLTNITNTPACAELHPAYSPSGKQIAFERGPCNSSAGGIFVMNEDGSQVTRLTGNGSINGGMPKWSPDGKRIGFTDTGPTSTTIYAMNSDGTGITQVLGPIPDRPVLLNAWAKY